jgi:hypothetical protein
MVVLSGVWLAAEVRRGRLDRGRAWRAAAATVAPALVAAVPFLLWHPADFLTDAVAYHLGLSPTPTRSPATGWRRSCCGPGF